MMETRYRIDYPGEFVITESKWSGGKKTETREWIANPIINKHISGRAVCIGSDQDRAQFDYARLARHRGGLLSSKKVQTYGVGSATQHMNLNFAVETNADQLKTIIETGYQQDNVVYTTPRNCVRFPEQFYLIPYNPVLADLVLAVYLAAFDQHTEIFLLGYTDETAPDNLHWINQLVTVFEAYAGTRFYLVGESTRMPDVWADCANVQTQSYAEFISYCDV